LTGLITVIIMDVNSGFELIEGKMKFSPNAIIYKLIITFSLMAIPMLLFCPVTVVFAEEVNSLDAVIVGVNELTQGETATIQISVQNNKTIDIIDPLAEQAGLAQYYGYATGLTARLEVGDAPVSIKTDKILLGMLPMGMATDAIPFIIEVNENADPGFYKLNLVLTYSELASVKVLDAVTGELEATWEEQIENEELVVTIADNHKTEFEITDIDVDLHSGGKSEIRVTFKNIGNNTAEDSIAKLSNAVSPLHLTDDAAFLGTLDPQETAVGIFELKVDGDAIEKIYDIDAQIKYVDEEGDEKITDVIKVPVEVKSGLSIFTGTTSNNILWAIIGASVIVVIWLIAFLINNRKSKRLE
jgi:hypothetical protein